MNITESNRNCIIMPNIVPMATRNTWISRIFNEKILFKQTSFGLQYRFPSMFQFMNEIDIFMIQFFKEQEKNSRLINQGQSMRQIRPKCAHFE